ncbi:Replication factor A protein 1 [Monosporozyma unispora]|nr:Replication factor A protein 1 [Kazachstania unispora]
MSASDVKPEDILNLFTNQQRYAQGPNGVFQVLNTRKFDPNTKSKKNIILITDGKYHVKALLRNNAADKFQTSDLHKGDIIQILDGEPHVIIDKKKFVFLVDDFTVLQREAPLNEEESVFLDKYLGDHMDKVIPELQGNTSPAAAPAAAPAATTSYNAQSYQQKLTDSNTSASKFSGSGSQKSKPIFAIEQLSPYQNVWTIKARVSYKGDIKTWHNQRGEGKLFNVNFLDTSGEIRATAFNDYATKFSEILQEGKVYYVSKARLQPAKPQFTNLSHPYELAMDKDTIIEECSDESNVPKTHFDFMKLNTIENQEANSTVDVIGIIQTVNPHFELTSKAGKKFDRRDITIVDDSNYSITVGLWNQLALDFNLPEGSVVAIKGVRVSDFGGKSLTMGFSSTLVPNPEIPEAYDLKGWYDTKGHDSKFTSLQQDIGTVNSANAAKYIGQRITLAKAFADNLGRSEKGDYFSVKAVVSFLKADKFAYPACSNENCNKKVIQQGDDTWRCEKCETNNAAPQWRYMLTISAIDETEQVWLSLFNDQAEQLLGIDASKLTELKEHDPEEFSKITQKVQMAEYDFRIRAREDNYNDESRIRYTVANLHKLNFKAEADYLASELSKALLV